MHSNKLMPSDLFVNRQVTHRDLRILATKTAATAQWCDALEANSPGPIEDYTEAISDATSNGLLKLTEKSREHLDQINTSTQNSIDEMEAIAGSVCDTMVKVKSARDDLVQTLCESSTQVQHLQCIDSEIFQKWSYFDNKAAFLDNQLKEHCYHADICKRSFEDDVESSRTIKKSIVQLKENMILNKKTVTTHLHTIQSLHGTIVHTNNESNYFRNNPRDHDNCNENWKNEPPHRTNDGGLTSNF